MSPLLAAVVSVGILVGIYGVVAIALNFQYGEAGLINFGVVAYFAVGAYTFAILTAGPPSEASLDQYRWGFDLHPLLAALIAGLVGVISPPFRAGPPCVCGASISPSPPSPLPKSSSRSSSTSRQ